MLRAKESTHVLLLQYQCFIRTRLDKERENMKSFKENVKKQFDERQRQVKETINSLKQGFEENRKDDADITKRKLERLEKQKNKGIQIL